MPFKSHICNLMSSFLYKVHLVEGEAEDDSNVWLRHVYYGSLSKKGKRLH